MELELLRTEFGLTAESLEPLTGGRVNGLWRCGDWVVKRYDHRQVPLARAERAVTLQHRLAAAGFPAPAPRPTKTGSLWAHSDDGLVVVMPFVRGVRRPRGSLTALEAANLGRTLGDLHLRLAAEPCAAPETVATRWEDLRAQALSVEAPTEFDRLLAEVAEYVTAAVQRMPPADGASLPWQLCHGDLHLDNILFDAEGSVAAVLDFDNAGPSRAGVELMMAWNLCFGTDPGAPAMTAEAAAFFTAYRQANPHAGDLATALRAYWFNLISNTWPAAIRYKEGRVEPAWVEILSLRYRSARWLGENMEKVGRWLTVP